VLVEASRAPYRIPDSLTCATLDAEIARLDAVLGPDIDAPEQVATLTARGQQLASDAAVDAVEDLTTGWIPYRGLIRQVTGASRHERARENAERAGVVRRAYLKGMRVSENCDGLTLVQAADEGAAVETASIAGAAAE
jgi:hypothetical protein